MLGEEHLLEPAVRLVAFLLWVALWRLTTGDVPHSLSHWSGPFIAPPSFSLAWPYYSILAAIHETGFWRWLNRNRDWVLDPLNDPGAGFNWVKTWNDSRESSSFKCFNGMIARILHDYPKWSSREAKEHLATVLQPGSKDSQYPQGFSTQGLAIGMYQQDQQVTPSTLPWIVYFISVLFAILERALALSKYQASGNPSIIHIVYGGMILSCAHSTISQWTRTSPIFTLGENDDHSMAFLCSNHKPNTPIMIFGKKGDWDIVTVSEEYDTVPTFIHNSVIIFFAIAWSIWALGVMKQLVICPGTVFLLAVIGCIHSKLVDRLLTTPPIALKYLGVVGAPNFIDAIIELEIRYPQAGKNFLEQFRDVQPEQFSIKDAPIEVADIWNEIKRLDVDDPNRLSKIQALQDGRFFPDTVTVIHAKSKCT